MKRSRLLTHAIALGALVGLAACGDNSVAPLTSGLLNDRLINNDVAVSAGDAFVTELGLMLGNEGAMGGMGMAPRVAFDLFGDPGSGWTVSRTHTCYDANDQPQAQCNDTTTSYIVFTLKVDGNFARNSTGPEGTDSMTAAVHLDRTHTISGLLGHETSRTHDGHGTSNDTTSFVGIHEDRTLRRTSYESALDSVIGLVFDLPHASNPFPTAGRIVRYANGSITLTVNDSTWTRTFDRKVEIVFPPVDIQGNVTLTITHDGTTKTCLLNLVTRRVTGCQ
jgi:hypothetical protein